MGQGQSGLPGQGPGSGAGGGDKAGKGEGEKGGKDKTRKYEPAAPPTRVGRKQRRQKGPEAAARLPVVTPASRCRLRLLKLERVKDYLLMEEEFVANQERLRPHEEKNEEDRSKVDDLRGTPMSVGSLEEMIDESHAIVSSSVGPEYYVNILSFVDKEQLEPGCSILLHNKVLSVVGILQDEVDPMVYDSQSGGEREIQRTMLELLNQMDGFDARADVKIHSSRMTLSDDVTLEEFVMAKDELSGADIKAICTEAGLLALRERRMKVTHADFKKAREKVMFKKKEGVPEGLYM
eukprot:jgi/Chlat1/1653/Chrsp127S00089